MWLLPSEWVSGFMVELGFVMISDACHGLSKILYLEVCNHVQYLILGTLEPQ